MSFAEYIDVFGDNILFLLEQHVILFAIALSAAIVLGVVLGTLVHRFKRLDTLIVPVVNVLQACPEIVLLALAIPFLGIGISGALIPLFVKGVLPILRNTASGFASIDPRLLEAARGMGMSPAQILLRVEVPAILPIVIAGVRISAVMLVSVLTLTAYIGVDSLGTLILQGISRMDTTPLLIGSGLTALLAITVNYLLFGLERLASRRVS
ncbi:ABC transporter permease [Ancylobacter dichloromethanicus]|uniref:Osmoprotectant ABC transporter permease n=1 Tax=Ancylobacter dichloromethanicus TaxID=518825 RepID=A0A9W6JBQ8_9HYPH|nr:ABC transporter permease [Ancylobacter dichloromethanicus]MBS7553123.1 ABC transporter permease [Ancylobacter dichloromethanicus]GLK74640.1 osmoprotectant ABC transporter permease [Ancylobacter dichloromethanicus]